MMITRFPKRLRGGDTMKTIQIQLALKASILGFLEVTGENCFHKHFRVMDPKTFAILVPGNDVGQPLVFYILQHPVESARELGFGISRWALRDERKIKLGEVDV